MVLSKTSLNIEADIVLIVILFWFYFKLVFYFLFGFSKLLLIIDIFLLWVFFGIFFMFLINESLSMGKYIVKWRYPVYFFFWFNFMGLIWFLPLFSLWLSTFAMTFSVLRLTDAFSFVLTGVFIFDFLLTITMTFYYWFA